MNRFSLPREEPSSPSREGRFVLDGCCLGFENGFPKFWHGDVTPIQMDLAFDYDVPRGGNVSRWGCKVYGGCERLDEWEELAMPALALAAEQLLDELLTDKFFKAKFDRYVTEHSKPKEPEYQSVFDAEIRRSA